LMIREKAFRDQSFAIFRDLVRGFSEKNKTRALIKVPAAPNNL
jgi:hypothetical protein